MHVSDKADETMGCFPKTPMREGRRVTCPSTGYLSPAQSGAFTEPSAGVVTAADLF